MLNPISIRPVSSQARGVRTEGIFHTPFMAPPQSTVDTVHKKTDSEYIATLGPYFNRDVASCVCVITFESSGKWPRELNALLSLKYSLMYSMHVLLNKTGFPAAMRTDCVDVWVKESGVMLRLVCLPRQELSLHSIPCTLPSPAGSLTGSKSFYSNRDGLLSRLSRRLPLHHTLMTSLALSFPSLPLLCSAVCSIISSHGFCIRECCDLICGWESPSPVVPWGMQRVGKSSSSVKKGLIKVTTGEKGSNSKRKEEEEREGEGKGEGKGDELEGEEEGDLDLKSVATPLAPLLKPDYVGASGWITLEMIELLCVSVYTHCAPLSPPDSLSSALARFCSFIQRIFPSDQKECVTIDSNALPVRIYVDTSSTINSSDSAEDISEETGQDDDVMGKKKGKKGKRWIDPKDKKTKKQLNSESISYSSSSSLSHYIFTSYASGDISRCFKDHMDILCEIEEAREVREDGSETWHFNHPQREWLKGECSVPLKIITDTDPSGMLFTHCTNWEVMFSLRKLFGIVEKHVSSLQEICVHQDVIVKEEASHEEKEEEDDEKQSSVPSSSKESIVTRLSPSLSLLPSMSSSLSSLLAAPLHSEMHFALFLSPELISGVLSSPMPTKLSLSSILSSSSSWQKLKDSVSIRSLVVDHPDPTIRLLTRHPCTSKESGSEHEEILKHRGGKKRIDVTSTLVDYNPLRHVLSEIQRTFCDIVDIRADMIHIYSVPVIWGKFKHDISEIVSSKVSLSALNGVCCEDDGKLSVNISIVLADICELSAGIVESAYVNHDTIKGDIGKRAWKQMKTIVEGKK
eukprot:gnl/Carplike_NY0171/2861_a3843_336.p1 GENE.gnl/Carplike_NY0171/2861_a3843_336~~gnl/Carplike_NY0171/2861_a3843_336.p1  ORF type:complete len:922 (+),score=287.92 gnl/Carplike_NY0171/2861_a3843_336:363-2768(+)